jgi:hypothetical protein
MKNSVKALKNASVHRVNLYKAQSKIIITDFIKKTFQINVKFRKDYKFVTLISFIKYLLFYFKISSSDLFCVYFYVHIQIFHFLQPIIY